MADPLGIISTVLDLYDRAKELKSGIEKVDTNRAETLSIAVEVLESIESLRDLGDSCEASQSMALYANLTELRDELEKIQEDCAKIFKTKSGLGNFRAFYLSWKDRNKIEERLKNFKIEVDRCHLRFSTRMLILQQATMTRNHAELLQNFEELRILGTRDTAEVDSESAAQSTVDLLHNGPSVLNQVRAVEASTISGSPAPGISETESTFDSAGAKASVSLSNDDDDKPVVWDFDLKVDDDVAFATTLYQYSVNLSNSGNFKAAISSLEKCVELRKKLSERDPVLYETSYAQALHQYAYCLSSSGIYHKALEPIRESAEIRKRLYTASPESHEVVYSKVIYQHAVVLGHLSKYKEALPFVEETLVLRRKFIENNPSKKEYRSDLARALYERAYIENALLNFGPAAEAVAECVQISRDLVDQGMKKEEADLAKGLNLHAGILEKMDRLDEALEASEESVQIRRRLAKDKNVTDSFLELGVSLYRYSTLLDKLDRKQDALLAVEECVRERRKVVASRPAYRNELASALFKFSYALDEVGKTQGALAVIKECVEIRRDLRKTQPQKFEADLATSLYKLAYASRKEGMQNEANSALQECVEIRRGLVKKYPGKYELTLASALEAYSKDLGQVEKHIEAIKALQEANELRAKRKKKVKK